MNSENQHSASDPSHRSEVEKTPSSQQRSLNSMPTHRPGFEETVENEFMTAQPVAGHTLGKFQLEAPIGRGGMGEVWKARDPVGNRDVVIKFVPPELRRFPEELDRVRDTFQRIHALQHQHICPTYLLDEDESLGLFLVMKYIDGMTLSAYRREYVMTQSDFPLSEVTRLLRPVADALDYAHSKKIVHRDIKPQNIMVSADGDDVQVVDFGLVAEFRTSMTRVSQQRMDSSGTYPYMAPEQWKGKLQNAATDQYALGVVAYELLCGHLPFEAFDQEIFYRCVINVPVEPLDDQPEHVNAALLRALAKQRKDRFDSCSDFVVALVAPISTVEPVKVIEETRATSPQTEDASREGVASVSPSVTFRGDVVEIKMPSFGDDMPATTISEVLVSNGDRIKEDQVILVAQSDEGTMNVPSPHAGAVELVFVREGDSLSANQILLRVRVDQTQNSNTKSRPASPSKRGPGKTRSGPLNQKFKVHLSLDPASSGDESFKVLSISVKQGHQIHRNSVLARVRDKHGTTFNLVSPFQGTVARVHAGQGRKYRGWEHIVSISVDLQSVGQSELDTIASCSEGQWYPAVEPGDLIAKGRWLGAILPTTKDAPHELPIQSHVSGIVLKHYFQSGEEHLVEVQIDEGEKLYDVLVLEDWNRHPFSPLVPVDTDRTETSSKTSKKTSTEDEEKLSAVGCLVWLGIVGAIAYGLYSENRDNIQGWINYPFKSAAQETEPDRQQHEISCGNSQKIPSSRKAQSSAPKPIEQSNQTGSDAEFVEDVVDPKIFNLSQ